MDWYMVLVGMSLQLGAVGAYALAVRHTRRMGRAEHINLPELSLRKPPFLYMTVSAACAGTGVLLVSIFALLQSDPVLLLSQVFTGVIVSLLLLRFKLH